MVPCIKVAFVDDDVDLLSLGVKFLARDGDMELTGFEDPQAILPVCSDFDVIIADYEMPNTDGITLLKMIRSSGNQVPFILFTGKGREEIAMEALNHGATFYLQKGSDVNSQFAILAQKVRMAAQNRRLKEQERTNEERFRLIESSSHDMIWQLDAEGKFTYISPNVKWLLGYAPEEVLGHTPFEYVERDRVQETIAEFSKNAGQPFQGLVYGLRGHDGSVRTFDVNGAPYFSPDGRIKGFIGSSRDISEKVLEQKKVAEELRRLAVLDALFHQTAAAVDENAVMNSVCRSVVHDLGYEGCVIYESLPDIRAARLRHAYPDQHRHIVRDTLPFDDYLQYKMLLEGKQYYSTEMGLELPLLGAWGIQKVAAVPLWTGSAVTGGLVILGKGETFFSDDEKQTLELVGRELSMTLDRVRMHQSLRQANQRLNLMSSIIRHDLQNQILMASGHLTIAQDDPATAQASIRDAVLALNRMDEMLRFSRHYQDIGIESPRWFNPRELWGSSVVSSRANHVDAHCSIPACLIQADPMVVRVLPNLIDNSLRHGGNVGRIGLHGERDGDGMQLTYEDDGIGLEDKEREGIFEIKYRGRHGHGLHLVREVLGITDITIESLPSPRGAKFLIRVPPHRCRIFSVV